jgi:hypothetical protein
VHEVLTRYRYVIGRFIQKQVMAGFLVKIKLQEESHGNCHELSPSLREEEAGETLWYFRKPIFEGE